jgi:hypothetical protein
MYETTNQLYDVYCMVMMTIGVFIAHKMLHQIGLCYSYQKTWLNPHILTTLSECPIPGHPPIARRIDASEETLRHFGRPQMYPAPAQSTRQQLRPA